MTVTSGRPAQGYRAADGTRLPGTTTIVGRFKQSDALIAWAWRQGMENKDYRQSRDSAADAGSLAHSMVSAHLLGKDPEIPLNQAPTLEIAGQARQAYESYLTFERQTGLRVISVETPLISEQYRYGGTPDCVLEINGEMTIGDFKTGSLYPDHLVQVAAYQALWNENYPDQSLDSGAHLFRFSRDYGDFAHSYYADLDDAWEMFKLLRRAYDLDAKLKKRVK